MNADQEAFEEWYLEKDFKSSITKAWYAALIYATQQHTLCEEKLKDEVSELRIAYNKMCEISRSKQAGIDRLMFENCPTEMTDEQIAEWASHQVPSRLL
jgi:hypothetical protein